MAAAPLPPVNTEISSVAPQTAPLSQVARIVNVFIAPSKTFTDLLRNGMWWAPFLLMLVVSWAFVYTAGHKVGFEKIAENQMQAQPKQVARMESMPAADRERAMGMAGKFTAGIGYAFPALQLLIMAILGGLFYATLKMAAGVDVKFGKIFAVLIYAGLPGVLRAILAMISLWAGASPDSFTMQNPLGSSLAYYLNPADSPFLYSLGSQLDVFLIWTLVLTAIGFTCISKVKRGTSFAIVFGWWLFFTLGFSSLALLA
jgi:hypothetical protein